VQSALVSCLTKSCSESDILLYDEAAYEVCASVALSSATAGIYTFSTSAPQPSTVTVVGIGGTTTTAVIGGTGTATATSAPVSVSGTKSEPKKNNTGLIVGSVIGGVGVIALIVIALLLSLRWKKRRAPAIVQQEVQLQPQRETFDRINPTPNVVDQKPQLHSESVAIVSPVTLANDDVFGATERKEIQVQIVPVLRTEAGEMQGEGRLKPTAEIQGGEARRGAQTVELDGDWDWVAGRSRKEAPRTGVEGSLPRTKCLGRKAFLMIKSFSSITSVNRHQVVSIPPIFPIQVRR